MKKSLYLAIEAQNNCKYEKARKLMGIKPWDYEDWERRLWTELPNRIQAIEEFIAVADVGDKREFYFEAYWHDAPLWRAAEAFGRKIGKRVRAMPIASRIHVEIFPPIFTTP